MIMIFRRAPLNCRRLRHFGGNSGELFIQNRLLRQPDRGRSAFEISFFPSAMAENGVVKMRIEDLVPHVQFTSPSTAPIFYDGAYTLLKFVASNSLLFMFLSFPPRNFNDLREAPFSVCFFHFLPILVFL